MSTKTITVDRGLLSNLAEILGIESEDEAFDFALRRLREILEIEELNEDTDGRYYPDFDPLGYLRIPRD